MFWITEVNGNLRLQENVLKASSPIPIFIYLLPTWRHHVEGTRKSLASGKSGLTPLLHHYKPGALRPPDPNELHLI